MDSVPPQIPVNLLVTNPAIPQHFIVVQIFVCLCYIIKTNHNFSLYQTKAGEGIRTLDIQLGKLTFYH